MTTYPMNPNNGLKYYLGVSMNGDWCISTHTPPMKNIEISKDLYDSIEWGELTDNDAQIVYGTEDLSHIPLGTETEDLRGRD